MRRRLAAASAALALGPLAGCTSGGSSYTPERDAAPLASASAPGAVPAGLERFYEQQLAWRDCRDGDRCAQLEVPLDYADPGGETIELAVLANDLTSDGQRIGSLVVNPGGPGVSGQDYAAAAASYFGREVLAAFEVVGFDPRGVGESAPIDCLPDERLDALVAADPDPDTPAETAAADGLLRELGRGCVERGGELASRVSTVEAARDIDILRAALGQDRLAYFGASYGTLLGATYAELFPERVGRLVLDGAVDPEAGAVEASLVQARGFESALRAYVEDCVDGGDCYLGDSVDAALARVGEFLEQLDAEPIPGVGDRTLTEGWGVLGIWLPLYVRELWPALDAALGAGLDGDGSLLMQYADQYVGRGPAGYVDNSTEANYAINCLDAQERVSAAKAASLEDRFEEASPTFGRIFAAGLTACSRWPVRSKPAPTIRAEGADPILVIGTTRDPATPLVWAEALADQLASGVLIRRDGDGHTGYKAGNECVDDAVEAYLVSGDVPRGTVDC